MRPAGNSMSLPVASSGMRSSAKAGSPSWACGLSASPNPTPSRRYAPNVAETRILVANRGEIAVRIMRTCWELGVPTIAVYSDVDRDALHVEMADEAYHIGPAAPAESYLSVERILDAAWQTEATAVHY